MQQVSDEDLRAALEPVIRVLEADGYLLRTSLAQDETDAVVVKIIAGAEACEDCLSPKSVVGRLIENSLSKAGIERDLILHYPTDQPN